MEHRELHDLEASDVTTRVTTLARLTDEELVDLADERLGEGLSGLAHLAKLELSER